MYITWYKLEAHSVLSKLYTEPFYQILLHLSSQKQELLVVTMFVNGSERNEHYLQKTFHRWFLPSFGSFGQAVSEEKIFRNRTITNNNWLWQPCVSTDRAKLSTLYRRPSLNASYQVSVYLASEAVSKEKNLKKLTNQKQLLPVAAIFVNGTGPNVHSLYRTFHRCFLPSFGSFGQAVSEEKI
jgi:hypothetical protein